MTPSMLATFTADQMDVLQALARNAARGATHQTIDNILTYFPVGRHVAIVIATSDLVRMGRVEIDEGRPLPIYRDARHGFGVLTLPEPLLFRPPGVAEVFLARKRKTPEWLRWGYVAPRGFTLKDRDSPRDRDLWVKVRRGDLLLICPDDDFDDTNLVDWSGSRAEFDQAFEFVPAADYLPYTEPTLGDDVEIPF